MRILVTSDTHRDFDALERVVLGHTEAQVLIHLGDGAAEAEKIAQEFEKLQVLQVRGNCDVKSKIMLMKEVVLDGTKIFMTHGHLYGVKQYIYPIFREAKEKNAQVLLFGHTHQVFSAFKDGIHIMNPGSLRGENGSYGILDITPSGVVPRIVYPFREG